MPSHAVGFCVAGLLSLPIVVGCSGGEDDVREEPTFWQDVAPIMMSKCVSCHQKEGIAHFPLDDYEVARERAGAIDDAVQSGRMPPFLVDHDGSCGDFQDDVTLTAGELDVIHRWAAGGRAEGKRAEGPAGLPPLPMLEDATEYRTPLVTPVVDPSNPLGANDEYRCYPMPAGIPGERFITGYQVVPGNPAIIHHAAVYVVNPSAPSYVDGKTNGEVMAEMDEASPERPGWDCFGGPGDAVVHHALPVTWAPGQNVVEYPKDVGLRIAPDDVMVVQMHYNLHGHGEDGGGSARHGGSEEADSTLIRLRYAESVKRSAMMLGYDGLLGSMFAGDPHSLPQGQANASYSWEVPREALDVAASVPALEVLGVMPHMHERGRTFEMSVSTGGQKECVARVDAWDFHWQGLYWYRTPPRIEASSLVGVTCTYDTRDAEGPVLPGWGTENEMCMSSFMVAPPAEP
ncbi:monooxygenase [Chondromyces apiculatus]|uniref:Putative thiol-disulfide isomerase or thioredoxin n=1 Tax=Chondromyces apiculatus DSM 436 TaxID=1192034 RepID=A0A017SVT1_9BACT|nr:hypothetical protein [Chondromyces apiculatus]EYF00725.1 putative thiol-disulfide isomerase or thioredoxin [Chondromyces apiculatus DSM 436]